MTEIQNKAAEDIQIKAAEYTTGGKLMRKRIKKNWEIEKISNNLNISTTYIQAIEDGDLDALPEMVYTIGFIRSYGDLLSLDTDSMVEEYKSIMKTKKIECYEMPDLHHTPPSANYIYAIAGIILIGVTIFITTNKLLNKSNNAMQGNVDITQSVIINNDAIVSDSVFIEPAPATSAEKTPPVVEESGVSIADKVPVTSKNTKPYPKGAELSTSVTIVSTKISYVHVTSPSKGDAYNGFLDKGQKISVPFNKGYMISSSDSKNLRFVLTDKNGKKYKLNSIKRTLNNAALTTGNLKNLVK